MIGIIGAMEEEVSELYSDMTDKHVDKIGAWVFYVGKLQNTDVVIVKSGIGKVNMAACAQKMIDTYSVDYLINTGVAGSLDANINIGDIVVSTDCVQHDMDAVAFGYDPGVIPQMEESVFRADKRLRERSLAICEKYIPEIRAHEGRVLSGDVFVADGARKEYLVKQFEGKCTEMEGASMAQVAYLNNIPFIVLRAISDKADGTANMDYAQFEKEAIKHLVVLVENLVR